MKLDLKNDALVSVIRAVLTAALLILSWTFAQHPWVKAEPFLAEHPEGRNFLVGYSHKESFSSNSEPKTRQSRAYLILSEPLSPKLLHVEESNQEITSEKSSDWAIFYLFGLIAAATTSIWGFTKFWIALSLSKTSQPDSQQPA